jgi:hypothetical protein
VQHFIRTRSINDAGGVEAVAVCNGFAQCCRAAVGVALKTGRLRRKGRAFSLVPNGFSLDESLAARAPLPVVDLPGT